MSTRSLVSRAALVAAVVMSLAVCSHAAGVLDDFEGKTSALKWGFWNGPEFPGSTGSFTIGAAGAHSGKMGGSLAFDFSKGGNYVQAGTDVSAGVDASGIRLWVRNTGGNSIGVRVTDGDRQTFQKVFRIGHTYWQDISIPFSGWGGHWGGRADGVFRGRPTNIAVLVSNDGEQKTGTVYLDDLRLVTGSITGTSHESEYVVSRFQPQDHWGPFADGDGGRSSFHGHTLSFDFSRGAPVIGVQSDLALMGAAKELIVRVRSSSAGTALRLKLGSHMQNFEKVVGTLNGSGEQTFRVALGDMRSWPHRDGENDGKVLWPLRLLRVGLERAGGPVSGDLELIDIRVKTDVAEASSVMPAASGSVANGKATFACDMRNLLLSDTSGSLCYSIRDFSGAVLARRELPVTVRKGEVARFEVGHPLAGRPFAECEFRYRTGSRSYGPVTASAVASLTTKGSDKLDPASIFGMGVYLYRYYPDAPDSARQMERAADLAMAAGVKWSREEFYWGIIETERGKFDWSHYDRVADTARRHGISVYGLIDYWNPWTKPYTPEGIADYAAYCKALVGRYKGRINHWEIWNEPNIFFWTGPKEMYPELVKAAYKAIKEADPSATVLACSTATIDTEFIKMVMKAGAPFDGLTVHPYRAALDDEGFIKELQDVAALTAHADGKQKPVWITEMGWSTDVISGVSEREQASLLARSYLCSAASKAVANMSWYDFRQDGECPYYGEHRLGILRCTDFAPLPGYRAFATVAGALEGLKADSRVDLGPGIVAYRFSGSGKSTVAIWSPREPALVPVRITGTSVVLRNLMGESTPVKGSPGACIALSSGTPVFVTGAADLQVTAAGQRTKIRVSGDLHAGGRVALSVDHALAGMSIVWPDGWSAERATPSGGVLQQAAVIPVNAIPGQYSALVKVKGPGLVLPVAIAVSPSVMEF